MYVRENDLLNQPSSVQVLSALQHFDAAQAALQNDDFKTAIRHFQQASDADPEVLLASTSECLIGL